MVDIFNFPKVNSNDKPEKQIADIIDYLIQFKETLEFELANISTENLSPELINKLNDLGLKIDQSNEDRLDEFAQLSSHGISISDIYNSDIFKAAVKTEIGKYIPLDEEV